MGLDTVEVVLWSEKEFEIEIPDNDAEHISTVGQFSTYIHDKLLDIQGADATPETEIFQRIKNYLVSEFRIAPDKIDRNSNFIKDLRLDR